MSPQNAHIEAVTTHVIALGGEAFGRQSALDEAMRVEEPMMKSVPL